jgi:hypothetical protein
VLTGLYWFWIGCNGGFKHGPEPSSYIKYREFLDHLNRYKLQKKNFAPIRQMTFSCSVYLKDAEENGLK